MKVLLVTTWETACGIAEHAAMLKEAVEQADPSITIIPDARALDPGIFVERHPDLVHLNFQGALHSRWTPQLITALRRRCPVVVTYHDTNTPNDDTCKAIVCAADATVIHEPCDDLPQEKVHYWRMGVPGWQKPQAIYPNDARPVIGTIGFPFGWKCQARLIEIAAAAGWTSLVIAPGATVEQVQAWLAIDPELTVCADFLPRHEAISLLSGCDATAFLYEGANTGQSGAICLGIAARKPVLAASACRQFRALYNDSLGYDAIDWCPSFEAVAETLRRLPIQRCDPRIVALAEQDSWERLGQKYAALYRSLQ